MVVLLGGLLAAHGALAWALHQRIVLLFGDDASYLILARSLRDWSYRELHFIGEPVAGRFPPVYPAILALWTSVFGESLGAVAVLGVLVSVSSLIALFLIVRRCWSAELGLLAVAVTAVNPPLVTAAGATASETLFTALTMWSLWAATVTDDRAVSRSRSVLAGAAAVLAAMTRSAGVTLIAALGIEWLIRRRWARLATLAAGSALTVGLWLAWTVYAPQRDLRRSYVDDAVNVRSGDGSLVGTFVNRVTSNVQEYTGRIVAGELGLPLSDATVMDNVGWLAFIAVFGAIGFVSMWGRWRLGALYLVAYSGLLAIWPYIIERFLTPVLPLVIVSVVAGAWVLAQQLTSRAARFAPIAVGGLMAGSALVNDWRLVELEEDCRRTFAACDFPASLDFVEAARFAATLPPTESLLIAPKSATLHYYSGRKSPYWDEVLSLDTAGFRPYLKQHGIRYIIAGPVFHDYDLLYRSIQANCEYFDLVRIYSPDTFIVVLRETPRPDGRGGTVCRIATRALARPRVG